ncbi:hypothetical protein PF005_g30624 [Phytophthora fragariae]|uniref:Secreted protein n=1 Tax=Phytophthora fragariae TaxID=53985 RepID=A0A6A4B004_9STRA|nr:hypothetical protein PF009_g20873 [Phytophthora fragariae]KAE8959603.1 hypothetical protein PF011_g30371 [Phytophthora fragariae]KAE9064656.1 hypothetical protein PF006_g30642 [Phytophthora fragariae]KAE9083117.1 hypothetical protein PF010_g21330 [Phytophthora fragariae]KAE9089112.1 hypothetical protein PF007_g19712 [Phytophthora fragariae]
MTDISPWGRSILAICRVAISCAACVQGAAVLTHGRRSIGQRVWFNAVLDDTRIHARSPRVGSTAEIRHFCTERGRILPTCQVHAHQ